MTQFGPNRHAVGEHELAAFRRYAEGKGWRRVQLQAAYEVLRLQHTETNLIAIVYRNGKGRRMRCNDAGKRLAQEFARYTDAERLCVEPAEDGEQCETCAGSGEVDERLGGIPTSGMVPCPDCRAKAADGTRRG